MDGVSEASSVVQLLTLAKDCLDSYQEVRLNTPQKHTELRLRLEIEAIVFDRWCTTLKLKHALLETDGQSWETTPQYERLVAHLQDTLRFTNPHIATLVMNVLRGLYGRFGEARSRLRPGSGDVSNQAQSESIPFWKKIGRKSNVTAEVKVVQQGEIGFVGATRYLAWDKKYFVQVLGDLEKSNIALLQLLDNDHQHQIKRQVNVQVLGTKGDALLSTAQQLSANNSRDEEFKILAGLKGVNIDEIKSQAETNIKVLGPAASLPEGTRIATYNVEDFSSQILQTTSTRMIILLNERHVLIEWRLFNDSRALSLDQILRLGSMVNLLNARQMYKSFHILQCTGVIKDEKNNRIGMIYDIPPLASGNPPQWTSLQSFIHDHVLNGTMPSVTERLTLARKLCASLHRLQTVHWLHKSLRSDNIICFRDERAHRSKHANSDSKLPDISELTDSSANTSRTDIGSPPPPTSTTKVRRTLPSFHLSGLDLSRPDHPSELNEMLSMYTTTHRQNNENIELYSHPDSLFHDGTESKPRFEAKFDIYSLGLVLLEIGLWRTLRDLRKSCEKKGADYRTQFKGRYCDQLRHAMGDIYWRATQRCLHSDFDLTDAPAEAEVSVALQLAFEKQVLTELERCNA